MPRYEWKRDKEGGEGKSPRETWKRRYRFPWNLILVSWHLFHLSFESVTTIFAIFRRCINHAENIRVAVPSLAATFRSKRGPSFAKFIVLRHTEASVAQARASSSTGWLFFPAFSFIVAIWSGAVTKSSMSLNWCSIKIPRYPAREARTLAVSCRGAKARG